ncbi:3-phosphoserine/phosphohydroxythreonine transaminase [Azohydromonas aeria]|uniref:3-phosphoserine/phosphohydroxythreonine transaminase n=1 Tax=Azohydromonas aeria TaxID=2590212 RepID=UPI0012FC3C0F|nr:3-phosphoserine/phosphohydroxythreonine transaminase [Azohydromonas aeria]
MLGYSFSAAAGPLPRDVVAEVSDACRDWRGLGSVLALSFVAEDYRELQQGVETRLRRLLAIPKQFKVLFMAGGASAQFALLPLNLLAGREAAYVDTGHWSRRALAEASRYGKVRCIAMSDERFGDPDAWDVEGVAYCHVTSNETADGWQFEAMPVVSVPLAADMTSDLLTRPMALDRPALVYAGTQKAIGVPGLTLVIVHESLLGQAHPATPRVMNYGAQAAAQSRLNTPPVFAVFVLDAMLRWVEQRGGVAAMAAAAQRRSSELYAALDCSDGFYRASVARAQRSRVNACFQLHDPALSDAFVAQARARGLSGLQGHPQVGGLRVSLYNGTPDAAVATLLDFMDEFRRAHG